MSRRTVVSLARVRDRLSRWSLRSPASAASCASDTSAFDRSSHTSCGATALSASTRRGCVGSGSNFGCARRKSSARKQHVHLERAPQCGERLRIGKRHGLRKDRRFIPDANFLEDPLHQRRRIRSEDRGRIVRSGPDPPQDQLAFGERQRRTTRGRHRVGAGSGHHDPAHQFAFIRFSGRDNLAALASTAHGGEAVEA